MTGMFYMDDVDIVTIPQTKEGMIDILRIIGGKETVVCTVPDDNASVVGEIMGREEVNASVTVDGPLGIRVGDYVRVDGTVYTLNREAGMEKRSDVEYRYDLVFESPLYRLLDKLFTNPVTGVSTFTVSRTLKEFVKIVVDCVNTIDPGWTVSPGIPDTDPVNLTFEGISCREVLTRLSDGFGMEFYLSGKEIRFVRDMENATGLVFEQGKGKGLYTVKQEPVDTGDIVTRVYPYGGTTNVFPADGDVNGRLRLPEGYLEDLTGYGKVVEREVVFDDIFPCLKASVDSVSGEYNRVITCEAIGFDINSYGIAGVTAKINFLSGDLMGESFAFTYTHASKRINLIRKEDRMAEPDSEGKRPLIPHDLKKVRAGDRFNLTDIYVPDEYKEKAIGELRARATDYLAYYSRPRVKFTLEVDHRFLRGRGVLRAGDTVTVKIPETGMEKPLRVNSVERNLGTGKMSCVVSNYLDERWEKRIEGEIASVRSSVSGDISDIRGEVSNVSRPSSLWYPDKLKEYLRLNEDGTISLLATDLIVEGHILSRKSITAYASDGSTPTWFDKLPVASHTSKGIIQIKENSGLVVTDGLISIDPKWKGDGKTYYAGTGLKLGTKTGSGETENEFAINFGRLAGTVVEGNDFRLSDGQKALDRLAACSWWGQKLPEDGIIAGALSGVTKINTMIHLDVAGVVGIGDKSGSWARLTGNRLDGMTVGGVMSDLYLNYSSPAKNVRIDRDGNLIVSGNIKATGAIVAYASDGSTPSWFDSLPVAGYDLKGILRVDQESPLKIADGLLTLDKSLVGGISDILPAIGTGNVITSLELADGGRKIQPYMELSTWHSGNDGSGSGLDADLLDGHHWSEIAGLNVATATKLLYARTINGTSFDGTANIVTNTWGAERPFSIADHDFTNEGVAIKVNGFSSYVLPLPSTIKATLLGNASSSTVATKLQTARTIFGQTFDGSGNVSGAMSGVTKINAMIHLDVAGVVGIGDKSGSWARLTGNRLDGMTVGGVMSDLYLNYTSPAKNVRVDKDGNLIVSGNIKATGAIVAYASDGSTPSWFESLPVAGYEDGAKGVIRAYSGQFTIEPATGLLKIKDGVIGGFGDIAFSGDGAFLSDVTASADKRTLTFTRVGKPRYTADEVGAAQRDQNPYVNLDMVNGIGIMCNPYNANATTANKYPIAEAGTLFYGTAAYGSANQIYGTFSSNRWFARGGGGSPTAKTSWREFAFLDSVVSKNGDTMNGSLVVNGSFYTNNGNYVSRIVGTVGGWERGLKWDDLGATKTYGSVTMFGDDSTPNYISIGFGMYNAAERIFVKSNGYVGIGTSVPLEKFHVWGNIRSEGYFMAGSTTLCPNLNADMIDGFHVDRLMTMDNRGSGNIIADNTIASGYGFGYASDGWPTTGSYINFSGLNNIYTTQIQGSYKDSSVLFVRTRDGDNRVWNPVHRIMTCQGDRLTSSGALKVGLIYLQANNEINCDTHLYIGYKSGYDIITNAGGGSLDTRGRIYAKKGITSYSVSKDNSWGGWHNYDHPFQASPVEVSAGSYYPVLTWSSQISTGYRQYASIGSLRDGGFGRVAITVGSSDNNSTSAKYFFGSDGSFLCDRIRTPGYIYADGWFENTISGVGLYNSAIDARWCASGGRWNADKPIFSTGYIEAGTYLYSQANGLTLQIGSQNAGFCHFVTTAPSFYFNKTTIVDGHMLPYTDANFHLGNNGTRWLEGHFHNWLRIYDTRGNEGGLYFQNWGGGITMQDSTYVRVYGAKCFQVDSSLYYSINNTGGYFRGSYEGSGWNNGRGALNVDIFNNGNQTPLIVAARGDGFESATSSRLFAMELLNSSSMMVFAFNAVQRFTFTSGGNFVANAAITAYSTNGSDMRRKTVINPRYDLDPRSLLKTWTFTYRWNQDSNNTPLVGMSAQQMLRIAPDFVMGATDERGDYYTFDYGRFGAIGLVKTVRYVLPWMDRMDKWKDRKDREIETLRKAVRSQGRRISELENIVQTLKAA